MEAYMWGDKMQRYLEQCCHNQLMRRINYIGLCFLCREKKDEDTTCYMLQMPKYRCTGRFVLKKA